MFTISLFIQSLAIHLFPLLALPLSLPHSLLHIFLAPVLISC
jgi:hypothetical protein